MKRARRPKQLSFTDLSKKKRKKKNEGARRRVPHRTRPRHAKAHPTHITLRARRGLVPFRSQVVRKLVMTLFEQVRKWAEKVHGEGAFQLVEVSIQDDHLHVIVEAKDKPTLSSGMRSFIIRFAKRLNRIMQRSKGKVWDDRYHRHDLATPTEVRNCLVYIFTNWKKHSIVRPLRAALCDPYSSASAFEGWTGEVIIVIDPIEVAWPRFTPSTWLLREGWKRKGPISPSEVPANAA